MKKSVKTKWVKALRSGKYKQTNGSLKGPNKSFCCLGVLCDISKVSRWSGDDEYDGQAGVLPKSVKEWAGLDKRNPTVRLGKRNIRLATLNDSGKTFGEIADIIEEQL